MALPFHKFGSPEFHAAAYEAGRKAFEESLAAGLPVFYLHDDGREVMQPDGRGFELDSRRPLRSELRDRSRVDGERRLIRRAHSHCCRRPERLGQVHLTQSLSFGRTRSACSTRTRLPAA